MRTRSFLFLSIFILSSLFAQNKKLTIEEALLGTGEKLSIQDIEQLQWITGTHNYSFVDSLDGSLALFSGSVDKEETQVLLPLEKLSSAVFGHNDALLTEFPEIEWLSSERFRFQNDNWLFDYDLDSNEIIVRNQIKGNTDIVDIEPKTARMAFTRDNNLFIALNKAQQLQVTFDGSEGISNGSSYVHRSEFGIDDGIFWSPQGNLLAFYRKDETMVTRYPLVDIDSRPAKLRWSYYPMAGQTSEQVQVGVYNINTGSTTYLETGQPKDQYLASVTWSPDEKYIYVAHLNRDQNHLRLVQYDADNGRPLNTLFEEKDEQWVEPARGPVFLENKPDRFLWLSKRDGFNHLYYYNTKGKLLAKLTKGQRDIIELIGLDSKNEFAFFHAASEDGLEQHGYRVKISSAKAVKLTGTAGINEISATDDGNYFINRFNNFETPRRLSIISSRGKIQKNLLIAENPLAGFAMGKIRFLKLPTKEGIELNARIILPPDFDAAKKYPAVVYVYGGPHGQMITNHWITGWRLWFQYMAQRGYIVFSLDNRGTDNRGLEFEQAIHRQLGTVELEDQMTGVDYLKSQVYVDSSRIGVHGWSYGGFLTISMMTRQPGVFKMGVAGGPVIDWRYYEVMYGERYMDTPQANQAGYDKANVLNYVDKLDDPLLVINGAVDPVVPWQNSLLYLRKAIDKGKQLDYFVYPGDEHNMRGEDRVHLYQKISDYIEAHL